VHLYSSSTSQASARKSGTGELTTEGFARPKKPMKTGRSIQRSGGAGGGTRGETKLGRTGRQDTTPASELENCCVGARTTKKKTWEGQGTCSQDDLVKIKPGKKKGKVRRLRNPGGAGE